MRLLEVGEIVEYYSRRYDPEPSHVGKVLESLPKGIPSYPHPMVKLEGKAGYLSAEHCMPAKVTRNDNQSRMARTVELNEKLREAGISTPFVKTEAPVCDYCGTTEAVFKPNIHTWRCGPCIDAHGKHGFGKETQDDKQGDKS